MCECGCGDFKADFWYRLADGNQMAVDIYDSCGNCKNPVVVTLHLFSPDEAKLWQFGDEKIEPFILEESDQGYKMFNFPVIGPEDLLYAIKQLPEEDPGADFEAYGDLEAYFQDNGYQILQLAVLHRLESIKKGKEK